MKKNIKEKIFITFRDLLAPLNGKPALVSATATVITLVSIDKPEYAFFLLGALLFSTHLFRKRIQWVIFISIAAGIVAHEGIPGISGTSNEHFVSNERPVLTELSYEVRKNDAISNFGCGKVESRLPRPKGTAFIVKVSKNAEEIARESAHGEYKVRLTEKRNLPDLPLPGDSICFEASWYPVTPPSVPGAFDTQNWLKSQNLAAYGKFKHWNAFAIYAGEIRKVPRSCRNGTLDGAIGGRPLGDSRSAAERFSAIRTCACTCDQRFSRRLACGNAHDFPESDRDST